jgi:hypothetical protein
MPPGPRPVLIATMVAAAVSGVPSTVHSMVSGRDPLHSVRAAASLLPTRSRQPDTRVVLVRGAVAHLVVSVFWAAVLARLLPRGHRTGWGALGGVAIYVIDLRVIARIAGLSEVRRLPQPGQFADHVAFGAVVGAVLDRLDSERVDPTRSPVTRRARRRCAGLSARVEDRRGVAAVRARVRRWAPGSVGRADLSAGPTRTSGA